MVDVHTISIRGQILYSDSCQVFTFAAGYHCIRFKLVLEKYPVLISRYQVISCLHWFPR